MNKAKVTCAGFFMCALTPVAVIVATFRRSKARYVLVSFEERSALALMAERIGARIPDPFCQGLLAAHSGPAALRTGAFDVETGASIDGEEPFRRGGDYWMNAEHLWINVDAYRSLVDDIHKAWIARNEPREGGPQAPTWLAWAAIRKLKMAAEG